MKEMLELYDEENKPLKIVKEKSLVHREGDFHRVIHVCIINDKCEILCNKRSKDKDLYANKLDIIFGGHLKSRESYEDAAIRELKEEIGMCIRKYDLKHIGNFRIKYKNSKRQILNNEFIKLFFIKTNGENLDNLKLQNDELNKILLLSSHKLRHFLKDPVLSKRFVPFKDYFLKIINLIEMEVKK